MLILFHHFYLFACVLTLYLITLKNVYSDNIHYEYLRSGPVHGGESWSLRNLETMVYYYYFKI